METTLLISSILLWLVVLFQLLLTFALIRRTPTASPPRGGLAVGTAAPEFSALTLDGETKTLAAYRGRRTALIFFSVHCQPCRTLLAQLQPLAEHVRRTGGELVLVSGDERAETAALVAELDLPFPVLLAPRPGHAFFADYQIMHTPAHCFLTPRGTVQASGVPVVQSGAWQALNELWEADPAVYAERR
ncbi:MAG TPA: redoxin domain-containing protein [Ktedonobacteraceae bacterium]